jgi:hypothetical protein
MITRLLFIAFLYAVMFLAWIGIGLFMLLAPASFIKFCRDNVWALGESRHQNAGKLLVRVIGASFVAFAMRFALRIAELSR